MKLDKIQLDTLYAKATGAFFECAANQAQQVLQETGIPFESIKAEGDSVRVTFSGNIRGSYTIETKLKLYSTEGRLLGWYCLHEDENENIVDDFLVFE